MFMDLRVGRSGELANRGEFLLLQRVEAGETWCNVNRSYRLLKSCRWFGVLWSKAPCEESIDVFLPEVEVFVQVQKHVSSKFAYYY
ncbi:hypothetical protein Ccrd_003904 [Cynara cardunculus var. scolymus]|uniref:Uncharacterized protein n=1 Tax=Cynara cardunculus var. scolymus TaxID=59895 RepID=A0A118JWB2_CYNCS|nr:hypothetical protein Ccrd_003904 [Cynara cardunculus var. scolymus]